MILAEGLVKGHNLNVLKTDNAQSSTVLKPYINNIDPDQLASEQRGCQS